MSRGELGRTYGDGDVIARQGVRGESMYVVQSGLVEVLVERPQGDLKLSTLGQGVVFGEMSLFTGEPRSATVRALGEARVLTVDRRGFLRRVHEDPSLAFLVLQKLSERVAQLDAEVVRLRSEAD